MTQKLLDSDALQEFFDQACNAASRETLPRFRTNTVVDNKLTGDFDPVTEADRAAEAAIRSLIERQFPDHDIVGEEYGTTDKGSSYCWIIDPIDGTRAFISGIPVWGTLIGLYHNGKPLAGVLDQPFTRERFFAVPGDNRKPVSWLHHAENQPRQLQTRGISDLENATLMTTSPRLLENTLDNNYFELEKSVKLCRYGCDCYAYAMLATGQIDLVVESGLNIYDIAALIPLVEGAGGIVTDWTGGSPAQGGQILAAANATLHNSAMTKLCNQS